MAFKFEVKPLLDSKAKKQLKSVPLIIPNDTEYDEKRGVLIQIKGK